jgi:hypothetical protein
MSCITYLHNDPFDSGSKFISGTTCTGSAYSQNLFFGDSVCMESELPLVICDGLTISGSCDSPVVTPSSTPTPTPSSTPPYFNIRFWIDASDESTITKDVNNKVSQWNDKGPYGYDLIQSNSNNQPLYTASTLNPQVTGLNCVSFNGLSTTDGTFMSVSGISFSDTGYTYMFVAGISRNEVDGFAFSMDGPSSDPELDSNYYLYSRNQGGGTDRVYVGAVGDNWYVNLPANSADTISRASGLFLGVVTGTTTGNSQAQLNGITLSLKETGATTTTITSIAVGGQTGSTAQFLALSEVMEIIVFDKILNQIDIDFVRTQLENKWLYSQWLVTPTPTSTPTITPTITPTSTLGLSPTPTSSLTPTPSPTTAIEIFTHGTVLATCSNFCNANYQINVSTSADANFSTLTIGDTIYGQGGVAGFVAYAATSTDTSTGTFRIAEIDSSGVITDILVCSGGSCVPL